MLVLTRKKHEAVKIGDDVFVHVIGLRGDRVQLGFDAPRDVPIIRTELEDRGDADASSDPDTEPRAPNPAPLPAA